MKILHSTLLALSTAVLLCGCTPDTTVVTEKSVISATDKRVTLRADGQPKAEITAAGDLKIDGRTVTVNATQRALLQTYHHEMNAMAADGLAIGKQGAALAGKAVSEAIKGAISGNTDNVESKVEAEAQKIEQQAMQLCKRLVTVRASQDALAASLPEFKPYATIDQSDVDDCGEHDAGSSTDAAQRAKVQTEIRQNIREGIRTTIRSSLRRSSSPDTATSGDAAAEADAAAEVEATSTVDTNKN